jgi:S1-C subfamily serine protease
VGTVSGVDRPLPPPAPGQGPVLGALTLDATPDPADDGAPLLDAAGKVIGVVVHVPSGGPPGVVALEGRSAAALVASAGGGTHTGPTLGMSSALLDAADAAAVHARPGALVVAVAAGGPAVQAGLQVGDVVTAVDGAQVTADHPLDPVRLGLATGQHVRLTVVRAGQEQSVDLTVA